jgi:DNA-binding transcriptional ArsR family regulator
MLEYSQPLNPRAERALAHPTRRAILEELRGKTELPPRAIAERLGIGAANVAYHAEVLTDCGAAEAVAGKRRGERSIRLPARSKPKRVNPLALSGSRRPDATEAQLKSLIEMASHLRPNRGAGA